MTCEKVVNDYFDALHKLLRGSGLEEVPECIWNCDETGIQFQHEPSWVVAARGQRSVSSPASQNRENTIMATINAAGTAMPPMVIVRGKTSRSLHSFATLDAPQDTVWSFQESGWITDTICLQWFQQVFLHFCGPQRPQILLLDSHRSHERIELLEAARKENIHILALPPHTTHILQPLDRTIFGPLKKHYNKACSDFMSDRPGNAVTKITWPRIFKDAWEKTMHGPLIKKAFQATGVWPWNRQAIPASTFLASNALQCLHKTGPPATATVTSGSLEAGREAGSQETPEETGAGETTATPLEPVVLALPSAPATPLDTVSSGLATSQTNVMVEVPDDVLLQDADITPFLSSITTDNLLDLGTGEVQETEPEEAIDIQRLLGQVATHGSAEIQPVADWNSTIDHMFLPTTETKPTAAKSRKRPVDTFRFLTSDEVMEETKARQEKEKKEKAKEERRQKKLMKMH